MYGQFLVIIAPGSVAEVLVLDKPTTSMQFIAENVYLSTITQTSYMIIICRLSFKQHLDTTASIVKRTSAYKILDR
jgi:hypothetical protein